MARVPFGSYWLHRKLAVGGMAEIFFATTRDEVNRPCVIKKVLPHLTSDVSFQRMFLDEARVAVRLNHPNIVQIFDLGREGEALFIAMEHLLGEDLDIVSSAARKKGMAVPVDVAARLLADAADALHYVHGRTDDDGTPLHIVHHDVSLSNLFVTFDGHLKLLDFGIARTHTRLSRSTGAAQVMGKISYMAPEQISGQNVDRRADVWALGVCLHELLTGQPLFPGKSVPEIALRVCTAPITPPSAQRADVPAALDEAVLRALTRDKDQRTQTAKELRTALEPLAGPASSLRVAEFLTSVFDARHIERRRSAALGPSGTPLASDELSFAESPAAPLTDELSGTEPPAAPQTDELSGTVPPETPQTDELSGTQSRAAPSPLGDELPAPPTDVVASLGPSKARATSLRRGLAGLGVAVAVVAAAFALWATRGTSGESPDRSASRTAVPSARPALAVAPPEATAPVSASPVLPVPKPAVEPGPSVVATAAVVSPNRALEAPPAPAPSPARPARAERAASSRERKVVAARAEPGYLSVDSNVPVGVWSKNVFLGETPLRRVKSAAGEQQLRLESRRHGLSRTLTVVVPPGESVSRSVEFRRGRLNVAVEPWANVFLDGSPIGQTPLAGHEVWEGSHLLRLVNGSGEKTVRVSIRPGEVTAVRESVP